MNSGRKSPVFVVFEGLDGAGKSTCAAALADALGAEFMSTPAPGIRECRGRVLGSFDGCQEAAQLFYLSTVFAASDKVKAALAAGRSVVMDRYFLSTQAYAAFRGSRLQLDGTGDLLVPANLTVYLDTALDIRALRLRRRGCTADDHETLNPEADDILRRLHRQRAGLPAIGRWLEIDNSGPDPAPVVQGIVASLGTPSGAQQ